MAAWRFAGPRNRGNVSAGVAASSFQVPDWRRDFSLLRISSILCNDPVFKGEIDPGGRTLEFGHDSDPGLWLVSNRDRVFLATETGDRTGGDARASLERSLARMGVDPVGLIQLHNLVDEQGWRTAMARDAAMEALVQAWDEGLTRFIGVTGHGTYAPAMHLRSLDEFDFASVLCPLNHSMMAQLEYAVDFEALAARFRGQGIAPRTIKATARRRRSETEGPKFSCYELPGARPKTRRDARTPMHHRLRCLQRVRLSPPAISANLS